MTHILKVIKKNTLLVIILDPEYSFLTISKKLSFKNIRRVIVDYGLIHDDDNFRFVMFEIKNGQLSYDDYSYIKDKEYFDISNNLIKDYNKI